MRWKETLYKRHLRRPIDGPTREAINTEFLRRRHEIPMPAELYWDREHPRLTIRSQWLSFIVHFSHELLVVDAELTLAAKMLATPENRRSAVLFIESIANDLGL